MLAKIRIGLFILYGLVSIFIAYGLYTTFQEQNDNEHTVMNFFAYLIAPIFFAISTVVVFALVFIVNKVEMKANTYQFNMLVKLVSVALFIDVILYSFSSLW